MRWKALFTSAVVGSVASNLLSLDFFLLISNCHATNLHVAVSALSQKMRNEEMKKQLLGRGGGRRHYWNWVSARSVRRFLEDPDVDSEWVIMSNLECES
ncbi:hypothetical protein AVEN_186289-1 [Araneus ventricosus]|uniref:Uncharacterized protein n=1 Tax=Araneus ventricosus TaxID=182803 RepID=A0A4Y2THB2_ARAVE|nr:hypothetical protein AVEN_271159-1 [Araneus ventricosus]GBN97437.1 hypothetical protein AVEN_181942-1 [Araneus ventricosus]GBN98489.1 hypothetical protein AVEN_73610-1 [Araneus ventricosus]GBN98495.1 hypothetical protein AVEN_186289-1 [Araneus ventricosus]